MVAACKKRSKKRTKEYSNTPPVRGGKEATEVTAIGSAAVLNWKALVGMWCAGKTETSMLRTVGTSRWHAFVRLLLSPSRSYFQ